MTRVEVHVGRLVEFLFTGSVSTEEIIKFRSELVGVFVKVGQPIVLCADLSETEAFSPDVQAIIIGLMRSDNPRIERAGYLTKDGTEMNRLAAELIGKGKSEVRQSFTSRSELSRYLEEKLSEPERMRLREFIGRG